MTTRAVSQIVDLLKSWSLIHYIDIIDVILVGSQADLHEGDHHPKGSDVDLVITINDNSNPESLFSDLALLGLQNSLLFHPLIMTRGELKDKLQIIQYEAMLKSGRRVYP